MPVLDNWARLVRWSNPASESLPASELYDGLPEVLSRAADVLDSVDPGPTRELLAAAGRHGAARFRHGATVKDVLIEYRLLHMVVCRHVAMIPDHGDDPDAVLILQAAIDAALQQATATLVEQENLRTTNASTAERQHLVFLSHDLLNNLSSVTLWLKLLRYRIAAHPEFSSEMETADQVLRSIHATVNGMERLLQAERLHSGMISATPARTDLAKLSRELVEQLEHEAHAKGLSLKFRGESPAVSETDEMLVRLILQNLIGNSIKYSDAGEIVVACEPAGNRWALSVSDHGPGIAPDQLDKIFDAFRRGATHGQSGIGLGLAIASRAAQLLGTPLMVKSELGSGSRFEILLPHGKPARRPEPRPG